jgi:teichuronic acid biosynthesis glycosyltransferase TuaH
MSLQGRRILYEGSVQPWELNWTFIQMLAVWLARRNELLYVDTPTSLARLSRRSAPLLRGPRAESVSPSLRVLGMTTLPAQKTERLRRLAAEGTARRTARWARGNAFRPDLLWTFSPYALPYLDRFPDAVVSYWTGDEVVIPREQELLNRSDVILCVSRPVEERHRAVYGDRVHFTPVAVDFERFDRMRREPQFDLPQLSGLARPIAGYAGSVNRRVDVQLVLELADAIVGTVVLVGPRRLEPSLEAMLLAHPKIVLLPAQPAENVARLMSGFDLGLISYLDSEFNRGSNPVKFYEYLALGLPVVATDVPALRPFAGAVSIGVRETFVERVLETLEAGDELAHERVAIARDHSFEALLERFDAIDFSRR